MVGDTLRSVEERCLVAVSGTRRSVTSSRHDPQRPANPTMEVDPETYEVRADGELLTCEPAEDWPWRSATFLF